MDMYTLQYLKWVTNREPLVEHRKLCSMSMTAWMGGKSRGDGMQVYAWLSPFAVPLKVSHFKSVLCCILCLVAQSCLTLESPWTVVRQAPPSMGILQATILEWVAMPSSRGSSQPRNRTRSPVLQADSLPSEPPGAGSPRTLERIACPVSRGPSHLRNRTGISCVARGFFTS